MRSIILLFLVTTTLRLLSNPEPNPNSASPFFLVSSECAMPGSFPLCSTSADVVISGPIADVTVRQSYTNSGEYPIEATYIFPASGRAAVYDMEMHIGSRIVKAEIMEKQAARVTYETARSEGKRTSLLEQSRPNIFQMNVANIMPGEQVDVVLRYTEFIIPTEQEYIFVYPTVVGPRYASPEPTTVLASASSASSPVIPTSDHFTVTNDPTYTFDFHMRLNMPVTISEVTCPSHVTVIDRPSDQVANVALHPIEAGGGNRDMIVKYRLSGEDVLVGGLTYQDGDETYFLSQIEPPVLTASTEIVPREYIFILDVSGSMSGHPLDVSKGLIKNLLSNMRPTDKFNVLFFAGSDYVMFTESVPATKLNIASAYVKFQGLNGSGGTELLPALRSAMRVPKAEGYARSFVIATDGYVMVEEEAFHYIHDHLGEANFFAFGIGNAVNRHLIEGIAHVGRGEPFIVAEGDDAREVAKKLQRYIESPLLTNISISASGAEFSEITPIHIPDLMAQRPIHVFGKYKNGEKPQIRITGDRSGTPFSQTVMLPPHDDSNASLKYLWAREKIRYLSDFNIRGRDEGRVEEITNLGLQYNLLTEYTSFVAVDHEVVNSSGLTRPIGQPLPLPQGVSPLAVGFEMELPGVLEKAGTTTLRY